jgi:hypothetical protein
MKHKSFVGYLLLKSLIFLLVFTVLHFAYDWLHQPWVAVFSGTDESFFQHAKMGFISYSLISLVEFFILRKRINSTTGFIFSRMLSAIISPWVMFLTWYILPAIIGKALPTGLEIGYALFMTLLLGSLLILLERDTEKIEYSAAGRIIIGLLYISSWFLLSFSRSNYPGQTFSGQVEKISKGIFDHKEYV